MPEVTKLQPTASGPTAPAPPRSAGSPATPPGATPPSATPTKPGATPAKTVKVRPKRVYPWKKIVTAAILLGGGLFVLGYGWKIWQFAQEKALPQTTVSLPAVDEAALAAIRSRATGVADQNFDQVPTGTRSNPFSGAPAPTTPTP